MNRHFRISQVDEVIVVKEDLQTALQNRGRVVTTSSRGTFVGTCFRWNIRNRVSRGGHLQSVQKNEGILPNMLTPPKKGELDATGWRSHLRSIMDDCFIDVNYNSELEHEVLMIEDIIQISSIELLQSQSAKPRSLRIQVRSQ